MVDDNGARWYDARITPDQFETCYALLRATFGPEELNDAPTMLADVSATPSRALEYIIFARCMATETEAESIISLIAGCFLALQGQGIGFIEYLVTRDAYRGQGHASVMLATFENAVQMAAQARGMCLRLVLGEVDEDLIAFKQKRGYHRLINNYQQPPIAFDRVNGQPLARSVPKHLMGKVWGDPPDRAFIFAALQRIFESRYIPSGATPQAVQNAWAYMNAMILGEQIDLIWPPQA